MAAAAAQRPGRLGGGCDSKDRGGAFDA